MQKFVTLMLAVTAAMCLAVSASADAIVGPALVVWGAMQLLPYVLVAAVVIVTIILLRKFKKK